LIEGGADINVRTMDPGSHERTALMWAAEKGLPDIVEALIAEARQSMHVTTRARRRSSSL
jgi:hypothetical protein